MSYTIDIAEAEVPANDEDAWELREQLQDAASEGGVPSPEMLELYEALKAQHPCIMEDPDGPWSDGPLLGNFRSPITTLGISYSRVEDTLPSVISIATGRGFVVFDPEDQAIHGPRAAGRGRGAKSDSAGSDKPEGRKWQFWK